MGKIAINAALVTCFAGMAINAMSSIMPAGYYLLIFSASVSAQLIARKRFP